MRQRVPQRADRTGRPRRFCAASAGHELSAMFDIAHGASLSAVWGQWARYVYQNRIERFVRFAKNVWNITEGSDERSPWRAFRPQWITSNPLACRPASAKPPRSACRAEGGAARPDRPLHLPWRAYHRYVPGAGRRRHLQHLSGGQRLKPVWRRPRCGKAAAGFLSLFMNCLVSVCP